MGTQRKIRNKLKKLLHANQGQLIETLRNEWIESEKIKMKRERRERVKEIALDSGRIILAMLLLGGVLAIAAVAPNIFTVFGRRGRKAYFSKYDFVQRVKYLKKKKLIETEKQDVENYTIALTEQGRKQALLSSLDELSISKQHDWDGMWRIVFFDIPENRKARRASYT